MMDAKDIYVPALMILSAGGGLALYARALKHNDTLMGLVGYMIATVGPMSALWYLA